MAGGKRYMQEDINRVRELIASGLRDHQVAEEMGLSTGQVSGIRSRYKIASSYVHPEPSAPPADFAEIAASMNVMGMARHYRAAKQTIRRWLAETGITPATFYPRGPRSLRTGEAFTPSYRAPRRTGGNGTMRRFHIPERGATRTASAQMYLQKYGSVFSAKTVDRHAPVGQWFVFGRRVSEDEMLAIAERKGFAA